MSAKPTEGQVNGLAALEGALADLIGVGPEKGEQLRPFAEKVWRGALRRQTTSRVSFTGGPNVHDRKRLFEKLLKGVLLQREIEQFWALQRHAPTAASVSLAVITRDGEDIVRLSMSDD